MTHILLYWNHICVLHRQEKAFLQELAGRLRREGIQLEVRFLGRWTIVTLPDGSISTDSTRRLILNIVLFIIVVAIGGFFFFRKMTHKELFCSASVLVVLNIVFGLIAYKMQGMFSFYFAELTEWDSLISSLLFQVTQNVWISAVINWILPPYIFVLFGKKASNES